MCGISGYYCTSETTLNSSELSSLLKTLLVISESRGKEASGIAGLSKNSVNILRSNHPASSLIRAPQYSEIVSSVLKNVYHSNVQDEYAAFIGHSRLVTNGNQHLDINNQPVRSGDIICIHNGIVINYRELWEQYPALVRTSDLDSEIITALINLFAQSEGFSNAVCHTMSLIRGTASIAVLSTRYDTLVLATNNGSLYYLQSENNDFLMFGSERYILTETVSKHPFLSGLADPQIRQCRPGYYILQSFTNKTFHLYPTSQSHEDSSVQRSPRSLSERSLTLPPRQQMRHAQLHVGRESATGDVSGRVQNLKKLFSHDSTWQDSLRRCTRCILPETMPFIEFDHEGVCNYCRHYEHLQYRAIDELKAIAGTAPKSHGYDCIVALSGGRDSIYVLHYVKTILGMNPVAYTYDWGMITDLARRNIARICGKLGVEHIIISANIDRKRSFIRDNITAWLRSPALGMIPLFMAGDKQYFYYLEQLKKRMGIPLAFLGENMLERTNFKAGFAGIKPDNRDHERISTLPLSSKIKMFQFYSGQYIKNPLYINRSIIDTAFATICYYGIRRDYTNLFAFFPWNEEEIISTIQSEYDFELAPDTEGTWRIGDGTSAFYNYTYYTVAGFTEHDTFRSNQIREGMVNRSDALKLVRKENQPRYETINWYLDIIGLEMSVEDVFTTINSIQKVMPGS